MFVYFDEPFLMERQFEKVYTVDYKGNSSIYYYKEGLYLKYLREDAYAVYNDEMCLLGTLSNFYPLQLLLVARNCPLHLN